MNDPRWLTAIHEASHATCALAQGGQVLSLSLGVTGGGLCRSRYLMRTDSMFSTAAGDVGEAMFADEPAPEMPTTARDELGEAVSLVALDREYQQIIEHHCRGIEPDQDDAVLRRWASERGEPENWAGRYFWAKEQARRILQEHRSKLLELARALFVRGELCASEITTIWGSNS